MSGPRGDRSSDIGGSPPRWLRRWLKSALPPADRAVVLTELDELYEIERRRRGRLRATLRYALQIPSFGVRLRLESLRRRRAASSGRSWRSFAFAAWGRDTARAVRRSPGWAAMTISALAIGVGGVSLVFGVARWVLLRPVPAVTAPDELVTVVLGSTETDIAAWPISHPDLLRLRERTRTADGLAGTTDQDVHMAVGNGGTAERIAGEIVTAGYFELLGVPLARGRGFTSEEELAGSGDVAVISDRLWALHWGRDPSAVGATVRVNGTPFTIVGVAPPTFHGERLPGRAELWFPPGALPTLLHAPDALAAGSRQVWGSLVLRRTAGATVDDVAAEMNRAMEEIRLEQAGRAHSFLASHFVFRAFDGIGLDPLVRPSVERALWLLGIAAAFLLLLACTNVANLGLLRSASLRPAIAVRRALGAGTARILLGRLAETCLLGGLGGILGIWLAWLGTSLLRRTGLGLLGVPLDGLTLDGPVVGLTVGAGILAGVAAGLGPALATRSVEAGSILGAARHGDRRSVRSRAVLVVAQNAIAIMLLVGAGLLGRTLVNLRHVDLGIDPEGVLTFGVNPDRQGYGDDEVAGLMRTLLDRLRTRPDVTAATGVFAAPFDQLFFPGVLKRSGAEWEDAAVRARMFLVSGEFFETYGIDLVAGREIRDDEAFDADSVAVRTALLNESAARALFPGETPAAVVGRTIDSRDDEDRPFRIVGIARDARLARPSREATPQLFLPWGQGYTVGQFTVAVRTTGAPAALGPAVHEILGDLDPGLPALSMIPATRRIDELLAEERLMASLAVTLAVLGAILAALGLYGVLAFDVGQRTREIGIRSALGAVPGRILGLVARTGVGLTALGGLLGLAGATYLSRFLESRLYGVGRLDVSTYAVGGLVLLATAVLATWAPARRALRVDPVQALRDD